MKKNFLSLATLAIALSLASPSMAEMHELEGPGEVEGPGGTEGPRGNPGGGPDRGKVNAGVGNGSEYGTPESDDADPGRSREHNQAGENSSRPNSPRSWGG